MCTQIESCTESERGKGSWGRDSVWGSQRFKLCEDLCFARVFDWNVHPPFLVTLLLNFNVQSIVNNGFGTQFSQHFSMRIINIEANHVEK